MDLKKFPGLKGFSLQVIEEYILKISFKSLKRDRPLDNLVKQFENLQVHLNNEVPWCLHDQIAHHILNAAERFFKPISSGVRSSNIQLYYKGIAIFRIIVTLIPFLKVTDVKLGDWSKPIQSLLIQLLDKMECIKKLDLCCTVTRQEPSVVMEKLSNSLDLLVNLASIHLDFICTDDILATLSEHCKSIQIILISFSWKVTDNSCAHLVKFSKLREIKLNGTSVTSYGYHKLLTETKSENLLSIGQCAFIPQILRLIANEPFRTYQLRRLQCFDVSPSDLMLICKYFPFLKEFETQFKDSINVPDLLYLSNLESLCSINISHNTSVKTAVMAAAGLLKNPVETLLLVSGSSITSLRLGFIFCLKASDLLLIASHCTNLAVLEFHHCKFSDTDEYPVNELTPKPFQKLQKFHWRLNGSLSPAEFVLRYAYDLKVLEVNPENICINTFFKHVLNTNNLGSLEKLTIDNNNNMSARMLIYLVISCKKLSSIGNFMYSNLNRLQLKSLQHRILRSYNTEIKL